MIRTQQMLVRLDSLFWLPLQLVQLLVRNRKTEDKEHRPTVIIKLMGMGSLVKMAAVCDARGTDKTQIVLLTREADRDWLKLLGFEKLILIRFGNIVLFVKDCLRALAEIRRLDPGLIIDFERCSNAVSLFRLIAGASSRCGTISFSANGDDRLLATDRVYGNRWLSHEAMFAKGLAYLPVGAPEPKATVVSVEQLIVVVNINSSSYLLARRYSMENFVALVTLIHQKKPGLRFYFTGVAQEHEYVDQVVRELQTRQVDARNQAGLWSVQQLMIQLVHCKLFITNDSGPLHLAALMGAPTVAIWGPTQPAQFGYEEVNHIKNTSSHLQCSPCFTSPKSKAGAACKQRIDCMQIKAEDIAREALKMMSSEEDQRTVFLTPSLNNFCFPLHERC